MAGLKAVVTKERATLAGDACLISASAFGAVIGPLALLTTEVGLEDSSGLATALAALNALTMPVTAIVGPLLAWRLRGLALTWPVAFGGALGGLASGALVLPVLALAGGVGWLVSLVTGSELAVSITMAALIGAAFITLVVWLLADAIHDLAPTRRVHPRLDVARIVAAVVFVIFTTGVTIWTINHPGDESGEALIFAIAVGIGGAAIAIGAQVAAALATRRPTGTAQG